MRVFHHVLSMALGTRLKMETAEIAEPLPARLRDVRSRGELMFQLANTPQGLGGLLAEKARARLLPTSPR